MCERKFSLDVTQSSVLVGFLADSEICSVKNKSVIIRTIHLPDTDRFMVNRHSAVYF